MATEVAFVVMVRVMAALSVVVVVAIAAARLAIFGVIVALLVGVLRLVAMDVARSTRKLWWGLPLGLVAFVVVDPLIPSHAQTMPRSVSFTRQHHLNVAREPSWLS